MLLPLRKPTASAVAAEASHTRKTALLRYRILRNATTLAGTSDMAAALRLLAVLSRDGQLDGYRIVTRGAR